MANVDLSDEERALLDAPAVAAPVRKSAPEARKGLVTVGLLLVAVLAIVSLVLTNFKDSTVYAKGVDQLLADRAHWVGRSVRIEGTLVRGSLRFREKPCEYEFDAVKGGALVHVRFASCVKPDTLRDDMPDVGVTAEGKLESNGEFMASNVLAKCPSKYDMKDKSKGGAGPQINVPPPESSASIR